MNVYKLISYTNPVGYKNMKCCVHVIILYHTSNTSLHFSYQKTNTIKIYQWYLASIGQLCFLNCIYVGMLVLLVNFFVFAIASMLYVILSFLMMFLVSTTIQVGIIDNFSLSICLKSFVIFFDLLYNFRLCHRRGLFLPRNHRKSLYLAEHSKSSPYSISKKVSGQS